MRRCSFRYGLRGRRGGLAVSVAWAVSHIRSCAQRPARKGLGRGQEPDYRLPIFRGPCRAPTSSSGRTRRPQPRSAHCSTPQAAVALKSATATIPIVFVGVGNPVGLGLVQSLSRPGGNITGLTTFVPGGFVGKQIEILRELVPSASKIALLINPDNPMHRLTLAEEVPSTARSLGITLPVVEATTPEELDGAFASAAAQHADAMVVFADTLTHNHAPRIIALAAKHHLPATLSLPTIRQGRIDGLRSGFRRSVPPCRRLRR